ncbi:PREDICTED: uncharacterized protein C11orf94 homolog [Cercocebus atys]|uniref:uncharacterized protein C11orf94 homolog n=1 Tax=Cercocebus atys TaxID=9531 RepID=UPI0005F4E489|nr:PREDICTED: uncharacterized protein C11orf94 homolog [Cercocebus atys]
MVLAMLGALHPRAGLSLFLHLILAVALLHSQPLRSQQSVPEAFSAPLELSQPLSGLVDGSISLVPFPCPSLTVETPLRGAPSPAFGGLSSQTTSVQGCQLPLPPMPSFLPLDYGILPKHPWPRGPRPLLSRAQQRKRDGPDLAEYYYDAHL